MGKGSSQVLGNFFNGTYGITMEFEKHLIQNAVEGASFAEKHKCQPPSSFPCVAVAVEVDPDPRPCYWVVEYVYRAEFETPFDYSKYSEKMLHQMRMHPDYEYKTTEGPRKRWDDDMRPPDDDDSWHVNTDAGHEGWERFDYTEERYWKRPKLVRETS